MFESLSGIGESNPTVRGPVWSWAIIAHGQHQTIADFLCRYVNAPGLGALGYAMSDGVFDQRLQHERRHASGSQFGWHIVADSQPIRVSHLHNAEILLHKP